MTIIDAQTLDYLIVPVFLLEVNEKGQTVYASVNPAWCAGANRTAASTVGKTAKEIFSGRFGVEAFNHHMAVAKSGKERCYDLLLPLSDKIHSVQTRLTPVIDATGTVVQIVGVSADKSAEHMANNMLADASAASSEIEGFIALAAHDLRAPMRNVGALADMLREDFTDLGDGKLELIDILEQVATKATGLISDILAHAQSKNTGETQITFEFSDLCEDIFTVLDPTSHHDLKSVSQCITADKTTIQVAIRNLCDNAIKHSGHHKVRLSVDIETCGENMIEIAVTDNGRGFTDPAIAFLDGGQLKVESGFGLLGVRQMINARGGRIFAENLSGSKGSVVRFTLFGSFAEDVLPYQIPDRSKSFGPHVPLNVV